jgi:aspartate oxidase
MNTDILIIGAGLTGQIAAAELRDNHPNLTVRIIDAGGAASSEIMGFSAPVNLPDTPNQLFHDTLNAANNAGNPYLAKLLAENALERLEYLEKLGLEFDRNQDGSYNTLHAVGTTFPRVVHHGTTTGKEAIRLLNIEYENLHAKQLAKSQDGAIAGAILDDDTLLQAKAIILAGGGFAGLWKTSTWSKKLRGDCLAIALDAGVSLVDLQFVQFEPTVATDPSPIAGIPIISTLLNEGAVLRNAADDQDILENQKPVPAKKKLAAIIQKHIDKTGETVYFDFQGVNLSQFAKKYPEYVKRYRLHSGDQSALRIPVKPAAHTTLGGIKIDEDCATSIPGLFAAGEATGGLHGQDRLGGNAGLEVLVFGKIAAMAAAEYANAHELKTTIMAKTTTAQTQNEDFKKIASMLDRYFTPTSTRKDIISAIAHINELQPSTHVNLVKELLRQKYESY